MTRPTLPRRDATAARVPDTAAALVADGVDAQLVFARIDDAGVAVAADRLVADLDAFLRGGGAS